MARRQKNNAPVETGVIVNVSSELSDKQMKRRAKKDAKAQSFHKSWWTRLFKNGVWPILVPFAVVMIVLVILPLITTLVTSLIGYSSDDTNAMAKASVENFGNVFHSLTIWTSIGYSLGFAVAASILCIVVGYPIAYFMAQMKSKILAKNMWVIMTMPIWISMLLRVLGLQTMFALMDPTGKFLGTPVCIIVGMIYMFIPFAIGPMYDSILVRDIAQEEAAKDLGCSGIRVFFTITLRNTVAGMLTGFSLVIVQAATSLIAAHYLGGGKPDGNLIAKIIENYFIRSNNWEMGCAVAVVLTVLVFIVMLIITLLSKKIGKRKKGKSKWKNSEGVVTSQ